MRGPLRLLFFVFAAFSQYGSDGEEAGYHQTDRDGQIHGKEGRKNNNALEQCQFGTSHDTTVSESMRRRLDINALIASVC